MAKIYKYSDSLSETHFFYAFPKENLLFLQNLITKKWDALFLCIPLLLVITKEVYFFQVTDLQSWKACTATSTLSSELSITRSRFSQL